MNRAPDDAPAWCRPPSKGLVRRGLLLAPCAVLAVTLIGWYSLPRLPASSRAGGRTTCRVRRGLFVHDVTEHGNVESANNVEVRCEVETWGSGTMILWIIPEGTYVEPAPDWKPEDHPGQQPPDLLVRLDSSWLEDRLLRQQIACYSSEAALIAAKNNYETALIALEEYVEGTFEQSRLAKQSKVFVAREALRKAKDTLAFSRAQLAMGYVTQLQVEADEFRVEKAEKDLLEAETDLDVLENYARKKRLGTLESNVKTTEARLRTLEHSHKLALEKLAAIQEQIDKCTIRAPLAGQVVYANVSDHHGRPEVVIEEGTIVRQHQAIIRLPDPKDMQVRARVNEGRVSLVEAGMPATIELDAFPDLQLHGEVVTVSEYPAPSSRYSGSVKEYETVVKINDLPEGLPMRPGMTAKVSIRVAQLDGVLLLPVQAVLAHGGKQYCVIRKGDGLEARDLVIGATNDREVVVEQGLDEGDEVVLAAAQHRDGLGLPDLRALGEAAAPAR